MKGFNALLKRKVRALRVFNHPAFRRHFASSDLRKRLVENLRTNLNYNFFSRLKLFKGFQAESAKVRSFVFEGNEFIIKNTKGRFAEGFIAQGEKDHVRGFVKAHHEYFRKNKLRENSKYILRTPKLIASIGDYLVLERIPHWAPTSKKEKEIIADALGDAFRVFEQVSIKTNQPKLQSCDLIPAGIHNGKVVLYSVYDYDIY